jgi:tRNA A37 threonylcarbamoyladenosine synthetase subunit TsaC/SUA5/YrdC
VRVSDHPVVAALLNELAEPMLTSTLLLPGDLVPENDPQVIRERLGAQVDLIIDAGPCPNEPTTVVDLATDPPVLVRRGRGDPARLGLIRPIAEVATAGAGNREPTRVK